jgi:beta-1,2-mannobiose phosphorylase / 1,2-beta-oligomannan phosphorylase
MKLTRYAANPILSPNPDHPWESLAVFNPSAWYDQEQRQVTLLYRAAESHPEYRCSLGLARSEDGYRFERASGEPVFGPSADGYDAATIHDPRMVKMGDWFYVTYACRRSPPGQYWIPEVKQRYAVPDCPSEFPRSLRINATVSGLAMTRDFKTWIRAGLVTNPLLDDRDAVLFPEKIRGRFVMMHRPLEWIGGKYGTDEPCAWIVASDDLLGFPFRESLPLIRNKYAWEAGKVGINTPPIRTEHGWLTIYHAVGPDKHFRIGALLLDLEDPAMVLHRTPEWLMEPEADYELDGFYKGAIFPCGAVVIDDTFFLYYGAADKYCAAATCPFEELIEHLLDCPA